jgi:hypothetical protein
MRDVVCALTVDLKADGLFPESVIVQIRAVAVGVGHPNFDGIVSDAVQWRIALYFETPRPGDRR